MGDRQYAASRFGSRRGTKPNYGQSPCSDVVPVEEDEGPAISLPFPRVHAKIFTKSQRFRQCYLGVEPMISGPLSRRTLIAFTVALSIGALGSTTIAHADPMPSGIHTWSGDNYDGLGGGRSGSQSTAAGHEFDAFASFDHRVISVTVYQSPDESWGLDFVAPKGQVLAEGRYEGAVHPNIGISDRPGLNVQPPWGTSSDITGTFTVTDVSFGEGQKVESFEVSYVQDREGFEPLTGELRVG